MHMLLALPALLIILLLVVDFVSAREFVCLHNPIFLLFSAKLIITAQVSSNKAFGSRMPCLIII